MFRFRWFLILALVSTAAMLTLVVPARAEVRLALVIGNSHYDGDLRTLPNPAGDARLMAETLRKVGFSAVCVTDANQRQMKRAIADFGKLLVEAGPGATGLFFYSGHGVQVAGINYLIPVGAIIQRVFDVDIEAVPLDSVLDPVRFAGNAVNIVMLDASRNNPLARGFATPGGLARIYSADWPGIFISFSTAPGIIAEDGRGPHSPYVAAATATMTTPGLNIHELFDSVRAKVLGATRGQQVTVDESTLTVSFYFIPPK